MVAPATTAPRTRRRLPDRDLAASWWAPLTWVALLLIGLLSPVLPAPATQADGTATVARANEHAQGAESPTPASYRTQRGVEISPEEEDEEHQPAAEPLRLACALRRRSALAPGATICESSEAAGRHTPQQSRAPPRD